MHELATLFETNRVILYSTYGQVFFVLGLAVMLHSRRYSQMALARSLWLLGAFGILHGMSEWAFVFIPIQEQYMATSLINLLWLAQVIIDGVSFAFLFQFGAELVGPTLGIRWLRLLPGAMFVLWGFLFLYVQTYVEVWATGHANGVLFTTGDVLARYLLALPGALLAALGLMKQVKTVELMDLPGIARYLRGAVAALVAYAALAGLLVEPSSFFPAYVLNDDLVWKALGIPVPVFRSLCGLAIAYCVLRAQKVFDVEMDRMVDKMEREQMLAVDRERIGRELHDGTIQSIYAAGLELEDVTFKIACDPALAGQKVRHVMNLLNRTIVDIRNYIMNLNAGMENRAFEDQLQALARELAEGTGIAPKVRIDPQWRRSFTAEQAAHLLQVARESFANVSRHAAATRVGVLLAYGKDAVTLEICDNGRGFNPKVVAPKLDRGQCLGLRNLSRRIELIGGSLSIRTALGRGTKVTAKVPLAKEMQ